jgi:tryptophan 2,3-dioxygenase
MSQKPLTYGSYLQVPALLSLQTTRSSSAQHDEMLFIVIHQVYELWFKEVLHEVDAAILLISGGRTAEATRLLRRVVEIERLLIHQIRILETMRPQDFLGFRYHLNPASGFQSVQFRELEFVLGLKDERLLARLVCEPEETQRLQRRLGAFSLSDAVDGLLVARGFKAEGEDWRLHALVAVYEALDAHADVVALCETLIEIDEYLTLWRIHHVQMVERMIGARRGTGGSEGVGYLLTTLSRRAFPDLWRVRTQLGQDRDPPSGGTA